MNSNTPIFVTVKVGHSFECLTSCRYYWNPKGDGRRHLNSLGSVLYGFLLLRALRTFLVAKLPISHWLVQVNSMLDNRKPCGQEFVFGDFFFCFLFSKVLTRSFFLCFLLEITPMP